MNSVDLSNENSSDSFVKCSSIHVDCSSDRKDKTSDTTINTQILFQTIESDWESGRAENNLLFLGHFKNIDLEAVPSAVIQAWKSPLMKVYGFFLVVTKKMSGREINE